MASDFSIRHAAYIVRRGGVIAYPTDTIYGLGCDPFNAQAVAAVNITKQRPLNKQFILLAANINQVKSLVTLTEDQISTVINNKHPTSWIIEANTDTPHWLVDTNNAVTIRISQHPDVVKLCNTLGHPVISTSANISGKRPASNSLDLHQYFHHSIDKILIADKTPTGKPSKIIRLCDNYVIRD